MKGKEYRSIMLTQESYNVLNSAKELMQTHSTSRITFSNVINEFIKKS